MIVVDPVTDARWSDLVTSSAAATVFQYPAWIGLIRDQYRFDVEAWAVGDGDSRLAAGIAVATVRSRLTGARLVALPFSDVCGPLARSADGDALAALGAAVEDERSRRGLPLEIHGAAPEAWGAAAGDRFLRHVVPLGDGLDAALARVHRSKRRSGRHAARLGVSVVARSDADALDAYFRLHVLTRRRHGLPTQPVRFFRRLAVLLAGGLGFVLLAMRDGRPVAGAVLLRSERTLTYKYAASDPHERALHAPALVGLEAIRRACAEGCEQLDLGRTELENSGLRYFKLQLGAEEHPLSYAWLGGQPRASVRDASRLQMAAIRYAPPIAGQLIGAAVYRHFG